MRKILIPLLVAVLLAGLAAWFSRGRETDDGVKRFSGNVEVTELNVGFKTAGKIRALLAEEGRAVQAGEKLGELDNAEQELLVSQARAVADRARAEAQEADRDFQRSQVLQGEGAISVKQLEAATRAQQVCQARVREADAALDVARQKLADTVLLAPAAALVLRKNLELGESAGAGTPVYTLGDLSRVWVKIYVSETRIGAVRVGGRARIRVDSLPGRVFGGTISYVASEAEFTPRQIQTNEERVKLVFGVKVTADAPDGCLKPGMPADVELTD